MRSRRALVVTLAFAVALVSSVPGVVRGQESEAAAHILIDKPVKAGDLTVFPSLDDPKAFYYVSDKPRLATDEAGRPQFSFLRWVVNVRSGKAQAEAREGEGGGIVHALVELSVTTEQIREAQRELQRTRPGAKIVGAVPFSEGTFGIVSSFKDPKGGLSTQVVGMGKAPLLDGEKAAISIQLTKQSAKILWESFETPAPDISFTFEMDVRGYHSPIRALIAADFAQIYAHEAFGAGFATTFLAADINAVFDELRRDGAIKLTQIGSDASLERLAQTAYDKLTAILFDKSGGLGLDIDRAGGGGKSLSERAGDRLKEARAETDRRNEEIRKRNEAARKRNEAATQGRAESQAAAGRAGDLNQQALAAQKRADEAKRLAAEAKEKEKALAAKLEAAKSGKPVAEKVPTAPSLRLVQQKKPKKSEQPKPPEEKDPEPKLTEPKPAEPAPPQPKPAEPKPAEPKPQEAPGASTPKVKTGNPEVDRLTQELEAAKARTQELEEKAKTAQAEADSLKKQAEGAKGTAAQQTAATPAALEDLEDLESLPSFSVLATYELKKTRQTGTLKVDLNKYTVGTLHLRFDENIGDLRQLKKEALHFRQVNLDDPLYKQREIVAMVDGFNAQDFGQFVNFVTLQLKKKHARGAETTDEVRVDRKNFSTEGNAFKLLYGWNGDDDRKKWMEYEYRAIWSFFGGNAVETPWKKGSAGAINLAPPFQRRKVALEADPDLIAQAGVRAVTVKLFFQANGAEQARQLTFNVAKQQLSGELELLLPTGQYEYGYEIVWRLPGNRSVSSGRQSSTEAILFIDELPTS